MKRYKYTGGLLRDEKGVRVFFEYEKTLYLASEVDAERAKDKEEIARLKNALNIIYYLDPIEGKKEYLKRIKAIAREALEGNNARKD
jgi:hypothetical protein